MSLLGAQSCYKPLQHFDVELQDFYHRLLSLILEKEKTEKVIIETLKQERIRRIRKVNSKTALQNTAYLFRYGPCYSSAVAKEMMRMIKDNPSIFRETLTKRCVNICCFGSASIIEIVAICKVLNCVQESFWMSTKKPLQIKVTVIGNSTGQWKTTIEYFLEVLLKTKSIFDSSKMTISVHLSKANPAKVLNNSALNVLTQADLVTIVKFASMLQLETMTEQLLWEVADNMKKNCILFFLETGMYPHCKLFRSVFELSDDFQSIFGPNDIEPFTLNIYSIQKCVRLFWSKFHGNICLTSCIINSGAWKKEPIAEKDDASEVQGDKKEQSSKKEKLEKIKKVKREWCEKQIKSQKTLEDYHQKVRQVLPKKKFEKQSGADHLLFLSDYAQLEKSILFKSKSKKKRIYL